jgi:hypothetical protein
MKKTLFATTAIVAAFGMGSTAAHAQENGAEATLDLSLGSAFYVGYADQDQPAGGFHESDYDFTTETEFELSGRVTLDNGIEFGADVEVNADTGETGIDENVIYVRGSFGEIELGHEDGAGDTLNYGATSVKAVAEGTYNNGTGSLVNYNFGTPAGGAAPAAPGTAPQLTQFVDSGDATKLTYYTPRFAGFRVGVSHAPDGDADDDGASRTVTTGGSNNNLAFSSTDWWEGGIEYVNSFNGFDIAASVTGATGNYSSGDGNIYAWSPGFVIGYAGFEFGAGASFGELPFGEDAEFYDVGIGYNTGPWSVSLTGAYGERDNNVTGANQTDPEFYEINTGVSYALGGGASVFASGATGEIENRTGNSNDYVSLLSGVAVSF